MKLWIRMALFLALFLTSGALTAQPANFSTLTPTYLRCEYRVDPIGMDLPQPRLSWIAQASGHERAKRQTAYQIEVATSTGKLESDQPDVWNSKKQESGESAQIIYAGSPLQSATEYFWKVRIWDEGGTPSPWSSIARWTTGLRRPEWAAQWISDPNIRVSPEAEAAAMKGVNSGYESGMARDPDTLKWVGVDLGDAMQVDGVRLYAADAYNYQEGSPAYYFPKRYRIEVANQADFSDATTVIDHTDRDQLTPDLKVEPILERFVPRTARYVRIVVTRLLAENELIAAFALAEMQVFSGDKNVAEGKTVLALDSTESPGWSKAFLVDGRITPVRLGRIEQPATFMRKSFVVAGRSRRAILYATARGLYEVRINGTRVGDHLLAPEWTVYDKRSQYQAYDVTSYIHVGENVLAAELSAGWFSGKVGLVPHRRAYGEVPEFLAHLEIQNEAGKKQVVATDKSWERFSDGPIRSADIYDGETYDARKAMPGWDRPAFRAANWKPVQVNTDEGAAELTWQRNDTIRAAQEIHPVAIKESRPGVYIFDLGQNMVGWVRIKARGPAGTTLTLRHGEMLNDDGSLYVANLREAWQTDRYILAGTGEETFEPHFTYHGFRYVEVTGLREPPTKDTLTGILFYSSSPLAGEFNTSNEFVNRLVQNIVWTQHGNMMGLFTDCPQRPERLGWTGDLQIFAQAAIYNMDVETLLEKFLRDLRDDQSPSGRFSDVTPNPMRVASGVDKLFRQDALYGTPAWADAGVIVPWRLYVNYADKSILEEHYDAAKAWVDYVASVNPDFLWRNHRGLDVGEWLNADTIFGGDNWPRHAGTVPLDVFATMFFAHSADLMSRMAEVLGKTDDAQKYQKLFASIKEAFFEGYVSEDGVIKGNTQAGYALALHFNLLPDEFRAKAVSLLLAAIKNYNDGHLSTGMVSTNRLMLELTRSGNAAEAYRLLLAHGLPSWGSMLDNGATTIWERWDGHIKSRGFQFQPMNSFNHFAFGAVEEWMWQTIVGLVPDEQNPGYKHFSVHPLPGGDLSSAHGRYHSIYGPIDIQWKIAGGYFSLDVTVPPNTSADIYVPGAAPLSIEESGTPVARSRGVSNVHSVGDAAIIQVGSGEYHFRAPMKPQ